MSQTVNGLVDGAGDSLERKLRILKIHQSTMSRRSDFRTLPNFSTEDEQALSGCKNRERGGATHRAHSAQAGQEPRDAVGQSAASGEKS